MDRTIISFVSSAGVVLSWTADKDYVLSSMSVTSTTALLSLNPSVTTVNVNSVSTVRDDLFGLKVSGSVGIHSPAEMNVPLPTGTRVYCSLAGAGQCLMYLDVV